MTDESEKVREARRLLFKPRPGETAADVAARIRLATSSLANHEPEPLPRRPRPEGLRNPIDVLTLTTNADGSMELEGDDGRDYEWVYRFTAETWGHLGELVGTNNVVAGLRALFERDRSMWSLKDWLDSNDIEYDFASFGTMSSG